MAPRPKKAAVPAVKVDLDKLGKPGPVLCRCRHKMTVADMVSLASDRNEARTRRQEAAFLDDFKKRVKYIHKGLALVSAVSLTPSEARKALNRNRSYAARMGLLDGGDESDDNATTTEAVHSIATTPGGMSLPRTPGAGTDAGGGQHFHGQGMHARSRGQRTPPDPDSVGSFPNF
eukprot:TRINITY_DN111042_c0_g1_i1.p1 TRINITY_DN111042_c0_g1~~TRINITY_DN111042_c0_g1_i1.p1  ORF type:complete len:175 (-),score=27.87 TRINITY_DN111042_c0_g1_i1:54-578(-)